MNDKMPSVEGNVWLAYNMPKKAGYEYNYNNWYKYK